MTSNMGSNLSRRRFLASAGLAARAALLARRHLFAFGDVISASDLVEKARKGAANATITVQ